MRPRYSPLLLAAFFLFLLGACATPTSDEQPSELGVVYRSPT